MVTLLFSSLMTIVLAFSMSFTMEEALLSAVPFTISLAVSARDAFMLWFMPMRFSKPPITGPPAANAGAADRRERVRKSAPAFCTLFFLT